MQDLQNFNQHFADANERQKRLDDTFDALLSVMCKIDVAEPTPASKFRLALFKTLAPFVMPSRGTKAPKFDVSKMSPEQLDQVFNQLQAGGFLNGDD